MKDNKSIAIIALVAICVLLAFFAFRQDSGDYKKKVKELEAANAVLAEERIQIAKNLEKLTAEYATLETAKKALDGEIQSLQAEANGLKSQAAASQANLNKLKAELAETRKQIAEKKNTPPNRDGDDLLNSLRIKTTKK